MIPNIRFIAYSVAAVLLCQYLTLPVYCALAEARVFGTSKKVANGIAFTPERETTSFVSKEGTSKSTINPYRQQVDMATSKQLAHGVKLNSNPDAASLVDKQFKKKGTGAFIPKYYSKNIQSKNLGRKPMQLGAPAVNVRPNPHKPQYMFNNIPKVPQNPQRASKNIPNQISVPQAHKPQYMLNNIPKVPQAPQHASKNIPNQMWNPPNAEKYLPSSLLAELNG